MAKSKRPRKKYNPRKILDAEKQSRRLMFLTSYSTPTMVTEHVRQLLDVDLLASGDSPEHIRRVSGAISVAILLTDKLGYDYATHRRLNDVLQWGAFSCFTLLRLRAFSTVPLTDANVIPIHDALVVAQEVMTDAFHTNKEWLWECACKNNEALDGMAAIRRDQRVLGKHWETMIRQARADVEREKKNPNGFYKLEFIDIPPSQEGLFNPYA